MSQSCKNITDYSLLLQRKKSREDNQGRLLLVFPLTNTHIIMQLSTVLRLLHFSHRVLLRRFRTEPQATTVCFEEQYTYTIPINHLESLTDRLLRKLCRHTNRLVSSYTKRATDIRCEVVSVHTVDYVITRHTYCLPPKSLQTPRSLSSVRQDTQLLSIRFRLIGTKSMKSGTNPRFVELRIE